MGNYVLNNSNVLSGRKHIFILQYSRFLYVVVTKRFLLQEFVFNIVFNIQY